MPNNLDNQPVFLYCRFATRIQSTLFRPQFEGVCVCLWYQDRSSYVCLFSLCYKERIRLGLFLTHSAESRDPHGLLFLLVCVCVCVNGNWCGQSKKC